jgi:hypothetical protein
VTSFGYQEFRVSQNPDEKNKTGQLEELAFCMEE